MLPSKEEAEHLASSLHDNGTKHATIGVGMVAIICLKHLYLQKKTQHPEGNMISHRPLPSVALPTLACPTTQKSLRLAVTGQYLCPGHYHNCHDLLPVTVN